MSPSGVVALVAGPAIRRWMQKHRGIHVLGLKRLRIPAKTTALKAKSNPFFTSFISIGNL